LIQAILGSAFFQAIIWPIIKNEIIAFVYKYTSDAVFKKKIDDAAHIAINAQTKEEKLNAS